MLVCCRPAPRYIELFLETDVARARPLTLKIAVRGGAPRGPLTAFDSMLTHYEFRREAIDGGISLPGSVVITPRSMDGPILIEVDCSVDRTETSPSLSWRQYAQVQVGTAQTATVRMFLTSRCGAPARGCTSLAVENCTIAAICGERGLACGDDGQCVRVDGWPSFASDAGSCGPNRCGPNCPPCASGSTCSDGGVCLATPDANVPCRDEDHDGYGVGASCLGLDCNDRDPMSHAGAVELCDSKDNDCNGMVDEGTCTAATNTDCATAQVVSLTGQTQRITLHPDTRMGGMGSAVRCVAGETHEGKELWFAVRMPANEVLDVYSAVSAFARSDSVLFVQSSCDEQDSIVCNDDAMSVGLGSRVVVRPAPGAMPTIQTLYVVLDGYSVDSNGPYRLEFSRYLEGPMSCMMPFNVGRGGAITGFMGSTDTLTAACASARFPDQVYELPVTHGRISINLTADIGAVLLDAPCPGPGGGTCFGANTLTVDGVATRRFAVDGVRAGSRYTLKISDF